jgi:hypothetical protein
MDRFIMTTHTTLSAARRAGWMDRPVVARVLRRQTPTQTTALLIANLELELIVSDRKFGLLRIPNRKKNAISLSTNWHNHSFLCVLARPGTRPTEAVTSLPSSFQNLIETPRLEFPATTTKLSPLPISNRDKMATFIVAALPLAPQPNHLFRRRAEPKDRPNPAVTAHGTSHESQITSHEFLSTRPITFSASTPVLDFAQQFCSEENFPAVTANRWNFGLCATIPREPRQARKGATVTGQLRVPRNTRSSSLARPLLKIAAGFSRLRIIGVPKTVRMDISPAHRYDGSRVTSHKLRVTDSR